MQPFDSKQTPTRPQSHQTGDVGNTAVALLLKRWGWTADSVASDYGEDLDCTVFIESRRTALHFRCQVKSVGVDTKGDVRRLKTGVFGVRIALTTATAWALSYFPVLLTVYDDATGKTAWVNASSQARELLGSRSGRTLTFHVPQNDLAIEQRALLAALHGHYARLLHVDSAGLICDVYPLIMPRHRALPFIDCLGVQEGRREGLEVRRTVLNLDAAPAWATAISTLDGPYIHGWSLSAEGGSIDSFIAKVQSFLASIDTPTSGEWLAYVRGPVRFSSPDRTEYRIPFWSGDLTDWGGYSKIGGLFVDDAAHAFKLPEGFLRCIARRARSWDGEWSVAPHIDVAVQLYASTPTTPGYRTRNSNLRQHAEGQFLAWECSRKARSKLQELLKPLNLVFREVEEMARTRNTMVGAITDPMFEPSVGLIPQARNWSEFEEGSVRVRLDRSGLLGQLPGREGEANVRNAIMDIFGPSFGSAPTELLTAENTFTPGLPLNHAKRLISIQRFRVQPSTNDTTLQDAVSELQQNLPSQLAKLPEAELTCNTIPGILGIVIELSFTWAPLLEQGTREAMEANMLVVARLFDALLPRLQISDMYNRETLGVLQTDGELYFEGDSPWGIRSRSASEMTS